MSNIIHLNVPSRRQTGRAGRSALIDAFAHHRRPQDDVFWLKENAELLNILECSGAELDEAALEPHEGFYTLIEKRIGFFPQYYRFLLSICLDLEDLGLAGSKGERVVDWVAREGLARAELSDLQRLEARRLMQRRGVDPLPDDPELEARARAFVNRSATFAMPNKKAAYELTHIVFYLSEYGRIDPQLTEDAINSLEFCGILAYLDQNADLLAEVCVALRFAGQIPSQLWETWVAQQAGQFHLDAKAQTGMADDYHDYLVCNWMRASGGQAFFADPVAAGPIGFYRQRPSESPLRDISACMFRLEEARSQDWHKMRPHVEGALSEAGYDILDRAQQSSPKFEAFFAGFARPGLSREVAS